MLSACPFYKAVVVAKLKELDGPDSRYVMAVNSHQGLKGHSLMNCVLLQLGSNRVIRANRAEGERRGGGNGENYSLSFVGMREHELYEDTMEHLGAELGQKLVLVLRDAANFSRGDVFCLPAQHFANQLLKLLKTIDIVCREVTIVQPTSTDIDRRSEIIGMPPGERMVAFANKIFYCIL